MDIACIYFPNFPIQFEIKKNPDLSGRAFAIYLEDFRVAYLSLKAKEKGIKEGMSLREAESIFPECIFLQINRDEIEAKFEDILEGLFSITPCVERDDYSVFLEISHLKREEIDYLLKDRFEFETKIGVASSKFVAKLASFVAEDVLFVPYGRERDFLERFSIDYLPISEKQRERLKILGFTKIGDLQNLPPSFFQVHFGDGWKEIYKICMGIEGERLKGLKERPKDKFQILFERPAESLDEIMVEVGRHLSGIEEKDVYPAKLKFVLISIDKKKLEGEFLMREEQASKDGILFKLRKVMEKLDEKKPLKEVTVILSDYERKRGRQLSLFDQRKRDISRILNFLRKKYGRGIINEGCKKAMFGKNKGRWGASFSQF